MNHERNNKMKRAMITAVIFSALFLSGCNASEEPKTEPSESISETQTETLITETVTTAETSAPKEIKPLSPLRKQAYYQNGEISVTVELQKLRSSLYYPEIVASVGAAPEMFAVEMNVRIKNISPEPITIDTADFSLTADGERLYLFGGKNIEIKPEKIENMKLITLCTLEQAGKLSGAEYCGDAFDPAEVFVPASFAEVIEVQSAKDVREYLYKRNYIRHKENLIHVSHSDPAAINAHLLGRFGENGEYFAVEYEITNRSDYALIIDPNMYQLCLCYEDADNSGEAYAEQLYVKAEKKLMYEPREAGRIDGIGNVYEMPDFICMEPDKAAWITIVYKAESRRITTWLLSCGRHDETCYAQYDSVYKSDCDF